MFACIHGRSVSESAADSGAMILTLVELAFTFSPLVEQTSGDTIVLDVEGQDLLLGEMAVTTNDDSNEMTNIANAIVQRAYHLHLTVNVAMATQSDSAIHSSR